MPERIFLAGASGAVGRRLGLLLVRGGHQVTGTTRSAEKADQMRRLGINPVMVDVFDASGFREAVVAAKPDIVIHQLTDLPLGLDPARMADARLANAHIRELGTGNLLVGAVAAGARRVVAQSTAFAYAPGDKPYSEDRPLDIDAPGEGAVSARGVASLEEQVLGAPMEKVILRYGKLYGPGTGFDAPSPGGPVHVDAAAEAALRAISKGDGIYNIAEDDGTVSSERAKAELGWRADFRIA
jgi:nucleoside-diphosphate-sugar epimerase